MKNQVLYKYRSASSFRHLADILLKNRLYAAPYFELNDPMEGRYLISRSGRIDEDMRQAIKGAKDELRICSLSRIKDHPLMWSHYADGNKGVVIGVEVVDPNCEVLPVNYGGPARVTRENFNASTPRDVLCRKLVAWEHEEEERAFVERRKFIKVGIHELYLGCRMSPQDKGFMQKLCDKICLHVEVIDGPRIFR